jgi:hypothetical protein
MNKRPSLSESDQDDEDLDVDAPHSGGFEELHYPRGIQAAQG